MVSWGGARPPAGGQTTKTTSHLEERVGSLPLLGRVADVRAGEARALLWAFAYHFALLCGYYVLRPIRDEMGIRGGVRHLQWLFTATFVAMLLAVPLYSALVARIPRQRAIPVVNHFFAANLLFFYAAFHAGVAPVATARGFFVWTSVYNLFVVSVFWSFMADLFDPGQAKRLFGFIAAGGSAGALAGPAVAAMLARPLGVPALLLVSAALLEGCALCISRLVRWSDTSPSPGRRPAAAPVGGGALDGIALVLRSRKLAAIALQTVLFTVVSTFLYFEQAAIVAAAVHDSARRTAVFAGMDLAVNVLSLILQSLATAPLIALGGVALGLSVVPGLSLAGFLALAAWPRLPLLAAFQAVRRASHYAVERPAREVLFTGVGREERYKSKSFIDTVVYRSGDLASAWIHTGLAAAGVGTAGASLATLPLSAAGIGVAIFLGRRHAATTT